MTTATPSPAPSPESDAAAVPEGGRIELPGGLYIEINAYGHHQLFDEHSFSALVELDDAAAAEFRALTRPAAGAVPAGHVVVPVEPTAQMWEAAASGYNRPVPELADDDWRKDTLQAWQDMLAAAPPQPPPGAALDVAGVEAALDEALATAWDELSSPSRSRETKRARDLVLDAVRARLDAAIASIARERDEARAALRTGSGTGAGVSDAARDVLAERRRQVEAEGWTPEHDDGHASGEMAGAAACYASIDIAQLGGEAVVNQLWPWSSYYCRPSNHRRNLVKAGALILAEIERFDRAKSRARIAGGEQGEG